MAPKLSRTYIENHIGNGISAETTETRGVTDPDVAGAISDAILKKAAEEIGDREVETMEISVPVTLAARDVGPLGGCITVHLGPVTWHADYKGDFPG